MLSDELANEEDGEGHKEFTSSFDFELVSSYHFNRLESVSVSINGFQNTIRQSQHQPLFLLHGLFLI